MLKILLAASPEPRTICQRILNGYELVCASNMEEVKDLLKIESFSLIVCTVLFDESRMFDLLRYTKSTNRSKNIPFVCLRLRPSTLPFPVALEGIRIACMALGAADFLDRESYQDEDEMRSDIEKYLK